MPQSPLYETDFYAWAKEQAALLRAGQLSAADIENIAEEIDSMGRGEKRELVSRLTVLLLHLLKWRFQPEKRTASWEASIKVQRNRLVRHLEDNPSLKPQIPKAMTDAYRDATLDAVVETSLSASTFPSECPWSFEQTANADFWPDDAARP